MFSSDVNSSRPGTRRGSPHDTGAFDGRIRVDSCDALCEPTEVPVVWS